MSAPVKTVQNRGTKPGAGAPKLTMLPLNQYQRLDVRPILESGGEPLSFIRERIARLQPDEGLLLIAPFLPSPLIEMLRGEGFQSKTIRDPQTGWQVYFWK